MKSQSFVVLCTRNLWIIFIYFYFFQDEHREKKWDEAIASLNSKTPFTMTTDLKNLLRLGIPISQRCTVWKATVDHKLMRVQNDKFEANYYKKLLANCSSSGQKLTSAAKQVFTILCTLLIQSNLALRNC